MAVLTINNAYCGGVCFGYLYNWYALDDARELTSSATWYVPSRQDFRDLADYFGAGGNYVVNGVGAVLKETGILFWESPNSSAIDSVGFGAKGSGSRDATTGVFAGLKENNYMWMSDETSATQGKESFMTSANDDLYLGFLPDKQTGNSIRLVSDATGIPDGTTTTYTGNDGKTYNAIAINELYWTTENLEETKYRNGDYIQGYDGGVYTPIDNATWAGLTTGALCLYDDNLNYACKGATLGTTTTTELTTTTTTTTTTTVPVTTTTTTSGSITYINGASFTGFGSNTEHSYIAQNITYINPGTIDKVTVNLDRIGAVNGVVTAYLYDGHIGSTDTSPAGGAALVGTSTNSINFSDLGIGGSSDFLFSSESVGVDYSIVLGFSGVSGWDGSNYVRLWRTEAQIVNGFFINVGGGAYNYEGTGSLHAQIRYTSTVPVTTTTTTI